MSIIAHCFTLSAFCTLYMGYFPIGSVVDALESHPKTLLSIFIIINLFFFKIIYSLYPISANTATVCVEPWQKNTKG